ncbi:MAG TPA: AfsR/SARP family transcriptional regulator, partial [Gaiellales bacterium]|nr:AfsR/SARP family transcriptional regulator [Gaiellales bacterium]
LVHAGQIVSADYLIDALWAEEPPATARKSLHVRIAALRKVLGAERIVSRGPGYLIHIEPGELDLDRFERLSVQGGDELREALAIWSGPPLVDFHGEWWAQVAAARLEEMRLAALEQRVDLDLAQGRHGQLIAELFTTLAEHPLRERLRAQLMLALYRSGRQADALQVYHDGRALLVERLGIEPYPALRDLETAILRQDPALDLEQPAAPERSILVAASDADRLGGLLALAEPLARRPRRELIVARPIAADADLAAATTELNEHANVLRERGMSARTAAFRSKTPGRDIARLATEQDVDLVLVDAREQLLDDEETRALLMEVPCDVGVVVDGRSDGGPVVVPFIGADHDWSAVEIGAWLARAQDAPLRLVGPAEPDRDSSRLLASASLAVQRALGVPAEPMLISPGFSDLIQVSADASSVVIGLSDRWRADGLGPARTALAGGVTAPVVLVQRGLRPGGLAPPDKQSRFTWSVPG